MAAATAAVLAGAAITAGATAYSANKSASAAESAQDKATSATRRAKKYIEEIADSKLDLSRIDPATIPQFLAPLIKIFSEEGPDSIYSALQKDVGEAQGMLAQVSRFSAARDAENAQLRRSALDAFIPGTTGNLDTATAADNRFLNFQLPEGARTELQRQAAEQAVRGGFASSGVQGELARARTFAYQMQNYWNANQAATQRAGLGAQILGTFGLAEERLPAPGLGGQLALQNAQIGLDQTMLNYQNTLDAFRENQRRMQAEALDVTQHERNVGIMRANLSIGQANAQQQAANYYGQQSAQLWGQAGQQVGQAIGQFGGSILGAQGAQRSVYAPQTIPYAAGVGSTGYPVPYRV